MISKRRVMLAAWDIWRAKRSGSVAIRARQQMRWQAMIGFARIHSPYYQRLCQHLPEHIEQLSDLPPVTKPDLMAHFDEWVTDPQVKHADVSAFIDDPSLIGVPYLGRYAVWRTSGTTGSPGIFLHDEAALTIYIALLYMSGYLSWITSASDVWQIVRRGRSASSVFATGGHFGGTGFATIVYQLSFGSLETSPICSAQLPLPDLVSALNANNPVVLATYPSVLAVLTHEQNRGRLRIQQRLIVPGGECLTPVVRKQAESVFGCKVHDSYAASEFIGIAFDCNHGRLHVNNDWVILEPVDADYHAVAPGSPSHTVLLTNLANRVQPLIRYEIGDSVTFYRDVCPCGSPLPAIQVEGRDDEILTFETLAGEPVELMPLPLVAAVEVVPGVKRFQLIQSAPLTLEVRLEAIPGAVDAQVWELVEARLRAYLDTQRLPTVKIERSGELPRPSAISAKFRHIWSECRSDQPVKQLQP